MFTEEAHFQANVCNQTYHRIQVDGKKMQSGFNRLLHHLNTPFKNRVCNFFERKNILLLDQKCSRYLYIFK